MSGGERYARVVDPEGGDSLSRLVRWLRPGATVLDVGTAGGALGRYLGEHRQCAVDGVERDLGAAALARRHYRRLVVADLDRCGLASLFPAGSYDYVVCADVLEHLRHPVEVLAAARGLLREGGHLLVSIPNVAYAPLLAELLGGELRYRPVGLLDETHVRFVTRSSLARLLADAGFATAAFARVEKPPHESEFGTRSLEALPPAVRGFLEAAEDAYTYQFLVDATVGEPQPELPRSEPPASRGQPPPLRFVSRLYWRTGDSPYQADRQVVALGEIGAGPQTLRFTLPREAGMVAGLLLELADREAILELHGLRVRAPQGLVWSWSGAGDELRRWPHERMTGERGAPGRGAQVVIRGPEPRLELPLGAADLAACKPGCTVEVELSWPLSPEHLLVLDRLGGCFTELAEVIAERDRFGALLDERLRLLQETERAWLEAVQERDRALGLLDERLALLRSHELRIAALEGEREQLRRLAAANLEGKE
ncbi:MAG TPA: class I SAM-dependent methyltransferase [Thermoanaerobaculia bacterium]|jgi:2-polyprenyl-3-methyl-5-hydroxy-6-metoxy-1,4-benzoquinol methylase|nr:class I SAM-dependent methyltransferase [Thermoanaerobaculia bacterium]